MIKNADIIREELYRLMILSLDDIDPTEDDLKPTEYETVTEVDDYIYRLDSPEHGATIIVYGFYTFDGELKYALAGVRGEELTLIQGGE